MEEIFHEQECLQEEARLAEQVAVKKILEKVDLMILEVQIKAEEVKRVIEEKATFESKNMEKENIAAEKKLLEMQKQFEEAEATKEQLSSEY